MYFGAINYIYDDIYLFICLIAPLALYIFDCT